MLIAELVEQDLPRPPTGLGRLTELAGSTGLEPAASGVTGRRSNQLNYDPKRWCFSVVGGTGLEPVTPGV